MTPTQQAFLSILRAALHGGEDCLDISAEQWPELFRLAQDHKVLPLVFETVHLRLRREVPELAAAVRGQVRNLVILQTLRTAEFLELWRALEEAGVTPLVVKGVVCRQLYPKPDHRPSSDEDVLIPPEQFPLCHEVMTRMGLTTAEPDPDGAWEVPYRREGSPLYIELHKHLFAPESDTFGGLNEFFGDPFRSAAVLEVQGTALRTMHPCDHMTYLIFHAFKHFLYSGFGIRQICDILLFAREYHAQIDWEWVRLSCRSIRAERFAAAVFAIGVRYLGFDPVEPWDAIDVDELPLLEDVLSAGIYGSAGEHRLHSSAITLEAVSAQNQGKAPRSGLAAAAFPAAASLEGRYPWLKERPWLLPAAWGSRILSYLLEPRTPGGSTAALKLGAERRALLKQYGILE